MALPPSRDLSGVPSAASNLPSTAAWSVASIPARRRAISVLTLRTAP